VTAREPWRSNRERLLSALEAEGFETILLVGRSNIVYASGIRDPSGYMILSRNCPPRLIVPLLDYHRILEQVERDFDVYAFYRGGEQGVEAGIPRKYLLEGDPAQALLQMTRECGGKAGVDAAYGSYSLLRNLVGEDKLVDASKIISKARSVKSEEEINLIARSASLAEEAFTRTLQILEQGVSEAEAASWILLEMRRLGAWTEAFPTIAAFYTNTAFPHHAPGPLRLSVEGPVLFDWGAVYEGYRSDMTRTFWWGVEVSEQFLRVVEAVDEAVNEALDVLGPGATAQEVDAAARAALRRHGLSKYFIHGLGHGVGVDIHEEPYLRPGSKTELEPGMVVTVEPGVYMPGLFGVRIEQLVLVTPSGFRLLTRLPTIIPF